MTTQAIKVTDNLEPPSILGNLSRLYRTKTQEGGGILDNPEEGLCEFYCAGYSKPTSEAINRQEFHKALFAAAVYKNTSTSLFPFKPEDYSISLQPDPANKFDPNMSAIKIIFHPRAEDLKKFFSETVSTIDLGFVPQKINVQILKNLSMINGIQVLKTRIGFNEKYCTTKIVLGYGANAMKNKLVPSAQRFLGIMDEM